MSDKNEKEPNRVIDLAAKKTEDEWAFAAQAFFESFTQLWFKWVGWTIALGGISYLAAETGSVPFKEQALFRITTVFPYFSRYVGRHSRTY